MRLRQALAEKRLKKSLILKFSRTYMFITKLLQRRGFTVPNDPINDPPTCYRGRRGVFLYSEKIGPGIVGTMLCCSQCRGYQLVKEHFDKHKRLPDKLPIQCIARHEPSCGVYQPIILYPMLKKPNNKPFIFDIPPNIAFIIQKYVLRKGKTINVPGNG